MDIRVYDKYDAGEMLPLYQSVGWTAYTDDPVSLEKGFAGSLIILAAYADGVPVGIVRLVGDGNTVVLIQDILVRPEYQRRGIGTALMKSALERYTHVRQIQLFTDDTEKTIAFYRSLGFVRAGEIGCCGLMRA